jgi:hypothetical protein
MILRGLANQSNDLAFTPDGRHLASFGAADTVKLWDASTGRETFTFQGYKFRWYTTAWADGSVFSPDGRYLALADTDRAVTVWDLATGQAAITLRGHDGEVIGAIFSPTGRRLASASKDGMVKLWDATTGQEVLALRGHTKAVSGLAISPDDRRLASASEDGMVKLWDAITGQEIFAFERGKATVPGTFGSVLGQSTTRVLFSPDNRYLVSFGFPDRTAEVWDAASGQHAFTLRGHMEGIKDLVFSPDGRRLASSGGDGTVRIWEATTGQEYISLPVGHSGIDALGLAFSPDGRRLVCWGYRGPIIIWDATPLTEETRQQREAGSLLRFLSTKQLLKDRLVADICRDQTISEPLRQKALVLAEKWAEDADALNNASWQIVRLPRAPAERYALALSYAEGACRLDPENGNSLNTLGVAQYRVGRYKEALVTLTRSDQTNLKSQKGSRPYDLAFLAMAQHQLGQKAEARATFERLNQALKDPAVAGNQEYVGFLHEAEALLHEKKAP